MTRTVTAEYDAKENVLRLAEPLEGMADHAKVKVTVISSQPADDERPRVDTNTAIELLRRLNQD